MLFYSFNTQEERKNCGGSAWLELQGCHLPHGTAIKDIISVEHIKHWQLDSLYVADEADFYREYGAILADAVHNDLSCGQLDLYGINYYPPAAVDSIVKKLACLHPEEYEILTAWLLKFGRKNGFYILGL